MRLLVGTRRHLLPQLPTDSHPIDLDRDRYLDQADISGYVRKILTGAGDPDSSSPYRHEAGLAADVAEEIARIAGRSFLIAGLRGLLSNFHNPHPINHITPKPASQPRSPMISFMAL